MTSGLTGTMPVPSVAAASERAVVELAEVARIMAEHQLDSVEMPSGLKVLKTTHASLDVVSATPAEVDAAADRKLEAMGIVNATGESGRVPVDDDEVMFLASRAPELSLDDFRPTPEQPQEPTDASADE